MWESYKIREILKTYIEILKNYMKNSKKNFHQKKVINKRCYR